MTKIYYVGENGFNTYYGQSLADLANLAKRDSHAGPVVVETPCMAIVYRNGIGKRCLAVSA
jgi:hypothetical protein